MTDAPKPPTGDSRAVVVILFLLQWWTMKIIYVFDFAQMWLLKKVYIDGCMQLSCL